MQESASARKTHGDRVVADALTLDDKEIPKQKKKLREPPHNSAGWRFLQHIKNKRKKPQRYVVPKTRSFDFSRAG
jgi:hypothetical protein